MTMNFTRVIATLSFALLIASCSSESSTTEKTVEKIGWKFSYPTKWEQLNAAEIADLEGKARAPMEEAAGGKLDEGHVNILYLRNNPLNLFTSTMQSHDPEDEGPYAEIQAEVFELLLETYRNAGIEFEHKFGSQKIDGLDFKTLQVKVYKPGTKDVGMNQLMFDRLIGSKNSLLVSINWNNPKDQAVLWGILDSSTFSIRD